MKRRVTDDLDVRFWPRVDKNGPVHPTLGTACWLWLGGTQHRYGCLRWRGRTWRAHRVAWVATHGNVPDEVQVLHYCDNPPCVNPGHLFLGDHAVNMADKAAKGRGTRGRSINAGSKHGMAKLNESIVAQIRAEAATTPRPELERRYGVSHSNMHLILTFQTWRHCANSVDDRD